MKNAAAFPRPTNLIQTIERMSSILDVLAQSSQGISLGELSAHVNLPKGTTHRLLASLIYFGFARQDAGTKNYSLGFKLVELGNRLLSQIDLREEARPFLQSLSRRTKETVHLVILDREDIVYIDKIEEPVSSTGLKMASRIGGRIPAHCTASGKVLLAYLPEKHLELLLREKPLSRRTENSVTDPLFLKAQLTIIREQGYAIEEGESEKGTSCVAAPILNEGGNVIESA